MSCIGTGLAVALLATLYGIIMARSCCPPADKLMQKEEIMRFRNYMMTEAGLVLLAEKQSPRYMQDRLNSFLDPAIHFNLDEQLTNRAPHDPPAPPTPAGRKCRLMAWRAYADMITLLMCFFIIFVSGIGTQARQIFANHPGPCPVPAYGRYVHAVYRCVYLAAIHCRKQAAVPRCGNCQNRQEHRNGNRQ